MISELLKWVDSNYYLFSIILILLVAYGCACLVEWGIDRLFKDKKD